MEFESEWADPEYPNKLDQLAAMGEGKRPSRNIRDALELLNRQVGNEIGNVFIRYNCGPMNGEWVVAVDNVNGRWEKEDTSLAMAITRVLVED